MTYRVVVIADAEGDILDICRHVRRNDCKCSATASLMVGVIFRICWNVACCANSLCGKRGSTAHPLESVGSRRVAEGSEGKRARAGGYRRSCRIARALAGYGAMLLDGQKLQAERLESRVKGKYPRLAAAGLAQRGEVGVN